MNFLSKIYKLVKIETKQKNSQNRRKIDSPGVASTKQRPAQIIELKFKKGGWVGGNWVSKWPYEIYIYINLVS